MNAWLVWKGAHEVLRDRISSCAHWASSLLPFALARFDHLDVESIGLPREIWPRRPCGFGHQRPEHANEGMGIQTLLAPKVSWARLLNKFSEKCALGIPRLAHQTRPAYRRRVKLSSRWPTKRKVVQPRLRIARGVCFRFWLNGLWQHTTWFEHSLASSLLGKGRTRSTLRFAKAIATLGIVNGFTLICWPTSTLDSVNDKHEVVRFGEMVSNTIVAPICWAHKKGWGEWGEWGVVWDTFLKGKHHQPPLRG